jgi:hypothetical protein
MKLLATQMVHSVTTDLVQEVFSDTLKLEESYSLGTNTTVFQAEVYAILACSDICQKARLQNETIHILSDSNRSVLVQNLFINSHEVLELSSGALYLK